MIKTKKGQVALEFLITYGWAIIIIVGIVASLFFMGIQNPERYVTSRCLFENSFFCDDFGFTPGSGGAGYVTVQFSNIVGLPVIISGASVIVDGDSECDFTGVRGRNETSAYMDLPPTPPNQLQVSSDGTFFLELYCSGGTDLQSAESIALDIEINYEINRPGFFPKTASGKLVGRT